LSRLPHVAIVVLNWNGREDTLACLASLDQLDYPAYSVIVVDNASSDGTVAAIRSGYPQVKLIEARDNLGYVGGNNAGLEYAKANHSDYTLLLNNDTEVAPDFLWPLVEAAEADQGVGVVGPTIYYFDRPEIIWSAGGAINWDRGNTQMIGLDQEDQGQLGEVIRPVDFLTGCALLIKMAVVDRVGLLDPRFFAYYEEAEWCVRISRAGYKIQHVPNSKIWHKISPDDRENSPIVHYYMTRNRLLFLKLSRAKPSAWLNTLLLEYGSRLLSWSIKPKWRYKASQRRAMIRAIRDYSLGNFGRLELAGEF